MQRSLHLYIACLLLTAMAGCGSARYSFNQRYAPGVLREDVALLQNILEADHPSLYWYTPKDSMDRYFAGTIAGITDSLTETQFRNRVASLVSRIRCGHTSVRFSAAFQRLIIKRRYPEFPLFLKTWGDSIVVAGNSFAGDRVLKRGTVITSINGRNNRQLLDSLFSLISTDGFSDNYKSQAVSGNFPTYYKYTFGLSRKYTIGYIDSTGQEAFVDRYNYAGRRDTTFRQDSTRQSALPFPALTRKELRRAKLLNKRSLQIDTVTHSAFMRLGTFASGRLRTFFRRSFRTIRQQHIRNLVVDLRENGGGDVNTEILLTKYLSDHPFKVADTVAAVRRSLKYASYIHPSLLYWLTLHFGAKKMQDGRFHERRYEVHLFQPRDRTHFNGNIYVLQGGYTFSASTMFISGIMGQSNVQVIGEETGGGSYGNSAMHLPTIVLPHSGIRVVLPLFRTVLNAQRSKTGHGIIPDIYVPPNSADIKRGIDPKITRVMELIRQRNKNTGSL